MQKQLGCLSLSSLLVAALTLLILGSLLLLRGGAMFSPGPLNAQPGATPLGGIQSHADSKNNCAACHVAPWSSNSMSILCIECHTAIAVEIRDPQSLHGALMPAINTPCYSCHTEHNGPAAELTQLDPENFPHERVGYSLDGHRQFDDGSPFECEDCHQTSLTQFDLAACKACHLTFEPDFINAHITDFGIQCLACHDGIDTFGANFDHARYYPLVGQHAVLACWSCHPNAATPADLRAAPHDCYGCHAPDDEHNGQFGANCEVCHTPMDWEQALFDHNQTNFPLDGSHVGVACEACHGNTYANTPQDCVACHAADDAHAGQYGADCAACHTTVDWQNATFDHALSNFPLEGEHIHLACEDCHQNGVYRGTPQDCVACHAADDAHAGQYGADCAACHTPVNWQNATFDHNLSNFPLTGAHLVVACADCHQNNVFAGTPQDCAACHADPTFHLGLFSSVCTDCHTTTAWSPATYNRPHTFPYNHGESGVSACRVCHDTSLNRYTCYGCHEHTPSNIAAEHREEGITNYDNCVECHPTGQEDEGDDD